MVERIENVPTIYQREWLEAENKSYNRLVEAGYLPQGYNFKKKCNVVFKIENEYKDNERTDIMYFKGWQEAADFLLDKIIKTTDYFNITEEEAEKIINDYVTREETKVLDSGLEHYFFETLEDLYKEYFSEERKSYTEAHKYEVLLFEFVADNSNHNKYYMVFK